MKACSSQQYRTRNDISISCIIEHYAVTTCSEPSTVLNGLSGRQSEMFGHIFIDVLLNFLRLSKLSGVEGFLKLCLFLELMKCTTLDILN